MDTSSQMIPAGEALAEVERLLDLVDPDRSGLDERTRLGWVRLARRVRGRVDALTGWLVGEADGADASMQAAGTPLTSWLGMQENLSRREAAGVVHQARALSSHPVLGAAGHPDGVGPARRWLRLSRL